MWLERLKRSFRTSIWRFTLTFTAIVLCICIGILALVYRFTIGEQTKQLTQQVLMTAQSLSELANTDGLDLSLFSKTIKRRSDKSAASILVLQTPDKFIGSLDSIPTDIPALPALTHFPIAVVDHLGQASVTLAYGGLQQTQFGPLLVGIFDDNSQARKNDFLSASIWALSLTLFVTLITGYLFNRKVLLRIHQMGQLITAVKNGDLNTRLPLSQHQDEFDTIALQINQMLDEIDNLIDSVAQVTDGIAHDLRTPLSRMRISIEKSLSTSRHGSADEEWKLQLMEELDRVIATFNAMLELSRIEKGVQPGSFKNVDLIQICRDVVELSLPLAEQKQQQLDFLVDPNEALHEINLLGEPSLLFRAIFNLVENAIKYTPENGRIVLNLKNHKSACDISVSDNGPGIPDELHDKVFQRLFQVDASRQTDGFGLGLSIVKAIAKIHGAELTVTSCDPGLKINISFHYGY